MKGFAEFSEVNSSDFGTNLVVKFVPKWCKNDGVIL